MDAFQAVRADACELHAKVVAQGSDPFRAESLVSRALNELKLELVWLQPDDPALHGAIAVFDPSTATIRCAEPQKPAERWLVAAHEIGHARLHPAHSDCATVKADLSRSTEAAPVGLQRVEDYGARERRELQADVWAREFLFPASLARSMHIDQEIGATPIAEKLALPLNVVRQQLLDAILFPEEPAREARSTDAHAPDTSQEHAAEHRGTPFLLQAGPGAGKTRTLIRRVGLLLEDHVDPAEILVVTFSNRAAGELVDRITAMAPQSAPRIWTGTFHAFGLDLIRRHHDLLDLPPDPALFDRSDAIEVLEEILPTLPLRHFRNLWDPTLVLRDIVGAISRAKDELVNPACYRELALKMLEEARDEDARNAAEKCLEVAQVYDLYEQEIRRRKAVDFGDLIMKPTLLLEANDTVRSTVQARHREILVDEYQDVNRASTRLLKAIAGDGARLWVVGDSRQAIYRFRGASSSNLQRFLREFPGAQTAQLEKNYRSSKEVVSLFKRFSQSMAASGGMLPLALESVRGASGIAPQLYRYEKQDDETEGIAANIRELESSGVALRNQAVLCRGNARLSEVASQLEARKIPVLYLGSLFEREEIRDLLALMSLAVDRFWDGLTRVATVPRYSMTLEDVASITRKLRVGEGDRRAAALAIAEAGQLSNQGSAAVKLLVSDLEGIEERTTPWDLLTTWALDRTRFVATFADVGKTSYALRGIAIWQFMNFIRDHGIATKAPPIRRLLDRVRQLVLLAEERDLRQVPAAALGIDAVRLMTIHGAKGLEFDAVHVPGLTVQGLPAAKQWVRCPPPAGMLDPQDEEADSHVMEEECLFFVATSRAKTRLCLSLNQRMDNGNNRKESRYLIAISGCFAEARENPQLPLPSGARRPTPITVHWPADRRLTDGDLQSYQKCPRRFFYTHALGLGSARKATAFTRTHDCLYRLIDWLLKVRVEGAIDATRVEDEFQRLWAERGPVGHAFEEDYRKLAAPLVEKLISSGAGLRFEPPEALAVSLTTGEILVEPDEVASLPDGTVLMRRIRTGHRRSDEYDRLEYGLFRLAGEENLASGFVLKALHLADGVEEVVDITPRKLANRRADASDLLTKLKAGWYPPQANAVSCPRCPTSSSAMPRQEAISPSSRDEGLPVIPRPRD
jgi:superfamily I DNA/RNA helicase